MTVNKIFLLLTFVSSAMCDENLQISTDTLNLQEFEGVWYDKGIIYRDYDPRQIYTCNRFNVTKEGNDGENFREVYEYKINGEQMRVEGQGRVSNSEVHTSFADLPYETVYTAIKYNDGKEMIVYGEDGAYYGVVSREPQLSMATTAEFEKLGGRLQISPYFFTHDNCEMKN